MIKLLLLFLLPQLQCLSIANKAVVSVGAVAAVTVAVAVVVAGAVAVAVAVTAAMP